MMKNFQTKSSLNIRPQSKLSKEIGKDKESLDLTAIQSIMKPEGNLSTSHRQVLSIDVKSINAVLENIDQYPNTPSKNPVQEKNYEKFKTEMGYSIDDSRVERSIDMNTIRNATSAKELVNQALQAHLETEPPNINYSSLNNSSQMNSDNTVIKEWEYRLHNERRDSNFSISLKIKNIRVAKRDNRKQFQTS